MAANSDAPGARILAGSFRQARTEAGLSLRELSAKVDISFSVLSYWETARRVPEIEDAATVLLVLGVKGERRAAILQLVRNARERDYLAVGALGISQQLAGMLECEREATAMTDWSPMLIPGLLQTSSYARAIFGAGRKPGPETEHQVVLRAGRREALSRVRNPLHLEVLISEVALRQQIGDPALMPEQLRYLVEMTRLPTVSIRVVPAYGDYHHGLAGPFVRYEFPTAPPIVHLEHHRSSAFLFNTEDVAQYQLAVDSVRAQAIMPEDSTRLIERVASEKENA